MRPGDVRTRVPVVDLALGTVLAALTALVALGSWPVAVDHRVYRWLPSPTGPGPGGAVGGLAHAVAVLATPSVTVALTLGVAGAVALRSRSTAALHSVVPPVLALTATVLAGKAALHRAGPPGSHGAGLLGYYPSGHTTTALVCVGTLCALLADARPALRARLRLLTVSWTAVVAAAMVDRRYHWLSDVVAGALLGALVLRTTARRPAWPVRPRRRP